MTPNWNSPFLIIISTWLNLWSQWNIAKEEESSVPTNHPYERQKMSSYLLLVRSITPQVMRLTSNSAHSVMMELEYEDVMKSNSPPTSANLRLRASSINCRLRQSSGKVTCSAPGFSCVTCNSLKSVQRKTLKEQHPTLVIFKQLMLSNWKILLYLHF